MSSKYGYEEEAEEYIETATEREQRVLEEDVSAIFKGLAHLSQSDRLDSLRLHREHHVRYLQEGLASLPASFVSLEASRAWIVYWIVHSLALLGRDLPHERAKDVVDFLSSCQHPGGGFGGGPAQIPHLAPTYASIATLVTLDHPDALPAIDLTTLLSFLTRMAVPLEQGGGFTVHEGGESDLRAGYCAIAAAALAGLDAASLSHTASLAQYVRRCQTFEGGLGGEPGNEAHGGYTYCGLAALCLTGEAAALDLRRLAHWAVHMQGSMEGGFRGRTNKLVDGCYSFWQGAIFPLLRIAGADLQAQTPVPHAPPLAGQGTGADFWASEQGSRVLAAIRGAHIEGLAPDERARRRARAEVAESGELSPLAESILDLAERQQHAAYKIFHEAFTAVEEDVEEPGQAGQAAARPGSGDAAAAAPLFNAVALQGWILACCQVERRGGLRDKPGKSVDYYHTCYCLSGLATGQWYGGIEVGPAGTNGLRETDPRLNVVVEKVRRADAYFKG